MLTSGSKTIKKKMSCHRCYSRKMKCDRQMPSCLNCQKANVVCKPAVNTRNTPALRKHNRVLNQESQLRAKIGQYEAYLKKMGIDPNLILRDDPENILFNSMSEIEPDRTVHHSKSKGLELQQIFLLLQGDCQGANFIIDESNKENLRKSMQENNLEQVKSYHQAFIYNASEWFENSVDQEMIKSQIHPNPFVMFHLLSIYMENVHRFRPIIKSDRLQEIFFSRGPIVQDPIKVCTIEPVYNALFFSIYCAAITSLTAKEFQEIFSEQTNDRLQSIELYYGSARYWLIKSKFLQSSDLLVFETFIILFRAIQPSIQSRSFIGILSMIRSVIERIGMEQFQSNSLSKTYSEQFNRWLIVSLELGEIESSILSKAAWTGPYPMNTTNLHTRLCTMRKMSDSNRDGSQDDKLFNLIRYELFIFRCKIREEHKHSVDWTDFSSPAISLSQKLKEIERFNTYILKEYLQNSDICAPIRAKILLFLSLEVKEMKISAYACEERKMILREEESIIEYSEIRQTLLSLCIEAIITIHKAYEDPNLNITIIKNSVKKPISATMHLLRICSSKRSKMYEEIEEDRLIFKAWNCLNGYYKVRKSVISDLAVTSTLHDLCLLTCWNSWLNHIQSPNISHLSTDFVQFYGQEFKELDIITDVKRREEQKILGFANFNLEYNSENFTLCQPFQFQWDTLV